MSWCAATPSGVPRATVVLVHGSDRDPVGMISAFRDWSERRGLALLAPLFVGNIRGDGEMNGYKTLVGDGVRYDRILLDMLEEAAEVLPLGPTPVLLFGFSGGAQFAHRFALAHPGSIAALSIAAPGNVTLIGSGHEWWPGVTNMEQVLGSSVDLDALRRVPVHAVVGDDDDGATAIHVNPGEPRWVNGANDAGASRGERLLSLVYDWDAAGITVHHETLDGVSHELGPLARAAQDFFDGVLGRGDES